MEEKIRPVPVNIVCRSALDKTYQTQMSVGTYSMGARILSGLKWLAICWALAVFFIFVPILHFVLVPGALLVGLFMFLQRVSLTEYMLKGELRCPNCSRNVEVQAGPFGWPKREICGGCRNDMFIEKA